MDRKLNGMGNIIYISNINNRARLSKTRNTPFPASL